MTGGSYTHAGGFWNPGVAFTDDVQDDRAEGGVVAIAP